MWGPRKPERDQPHVYLIPTLLKRLAVPTSKNKNITVKEKLELCSYCGKNGHGKTSPARVLKTECPMLSHKCLHCNQNHRLENVCHRETESNDSAPSQSSIDDCEGLYSMLFAP